MTDSTNRPDDGQSDIPADDAHIHPASAVPAPTASTSAEPWPATTQPFDAQPVEAAPVATAEGESFRRDRRGLLVPVIAAAVVAALLGGGVGAGIAIAMNPRDAVTTSSATGSGAGVVINNPSTATTVSAVAAKASPSVVTISVSSASEAGTGSGIVVTADGYVLTNNHVVTLDGDTSGGTISVTTSNGRIFKAKVVGTDPLNDLAVIKLEGATGLTPAAFATSGALNVGDAVVAIGAPLDLPNTVTTGIVSALGRSIAVASSAVPESGSSSGGDSGSQGSSPFNFWDFGNGGDTGTQTQAQTANIYLSVLQTDAAINPGNSGGALLNSQGEVIGVNVAIAGTGSSSGGQSGSIGVGFAIPATVAKRIADELIAGQKVTHGQLGVESPSDATSTTGTVAGVPVSKATAGGPAAKAGIKSGDVITAVNGVPVTSYTDLAGQVRSYPGGTTVKVTYQRGGTASTASVALGTLSAAS